MMSWTRRTRFGGVGWEQAEVPLNEESEAYRLEILDGAEVARSVDLDTPGYLYTAAEQTADHGAPVTTFPVRIAQLSATTGAGLTLQETVYA